MIQFVEHRADDSIVERDLAVVRAIGECIVQRRGRIVGVVRVVEMEPEEERRVVQSAKPFDRGRCRAVAAPLELYAVVVHVEAASEAVPPIQHERADERTRAVSTIVQHGRERWNRRGQRKVAVVADAVREWIGAGQQARVRGQRNRRGRDRTLEQHALARELIDPPCARLLISVRANMIGARRIERNQQDVRTRRTRSNGSRYEKESGQDGEAGKKQRPPQSPRRTQR